MVYHVNLITVEFSENYLRCWGNKMNHVKLLRNTILAFAAAFVIFFAPVDENKASAASTISADELRTTASKYVGVRYSYGGTSTKGFDCSGYVRHVFNELGKSLPRSSSAMYGEGESVKKSDLQPGDLVFFNTSGRGVSHVGIYIGSGKFIHASTSKGVIKTSLNDKYYWGNKFVGAKRVASIGDTAVAVADDHDDVDNTPESAE